jgi:hypothetical protein
MKALGADDEYFYLDDTPHRTAPHFRVTTDLKEKM